MKRLARSSRQQLALTLEREAQHDMQEDQRAALLAALSDLLLEALGVTPPDASNEQGEDHES
jgi:hypothetical protein